MSVSKRSHDAAIPHLSRLSRVPEATTLLRAALASEQPWGAFNAAPSLSVRAVTVLRGHPGSRWTLRYVVRWGATERTIIAKVYARDPSDIAATLATLRRAGLGAGAHTQVPALIAYAPALRLLLQEEAPGQTARAALKQGCADAAERTAHWLAAFHAASPPLPAAYMLTDPLAKAWRWLQALSVDAPTLAKHAQRLFAMLRDMRPPWPPSSPHLVHGDFSASHVYLAANTTTVIDWDSCGVGDSAEDAGRFLASLHRSAVRDPALRGSMQQAMDRFTRTYRAEAPQAAQHLAFYEGLACLHIAKRLAADGRPHRIRHAQALLAAGTQALTVERG